MIDRRHLLLLPFGFLLAAAAPKTRDGQGLDLSPPSDPFPIPPLPPTNPPAFQTAPMPDASVSAPLPEPDTGPKIRPDLFNQKAYNGGQGYTPGSTIERQQQQRDKPIPGINITMPLR